MNDPVDIDPSIDPTITTKFHLDPVLARTLERYYILKWDRSYCCKQIQKYGYIYHQGIKYIPTFLHHIENSENVLLSFRYVEHGDPYGYVLIKPYTNNSLRKIL